MPKLEELLSRIDKEFSAVEERIKNNQSQQVDAYRDRQQRLAKFEQTLDRLARSGGRGWRPLPNALASVLK